jgi:hypothetical protein
MSEREHDERRKDIEKTKELFRLARVLERKCAKKWESIVLSNPMRQSYKLSLVFKKRLAL